MTDEQWQFLEGEFLTNSINGALQHSSTYANKNEKDHETVRAVIRSVLCDLATRYSGEVSDKHVKNIEDLARRVTEKCASLLKGGHLRFGVAQKALNLYLKYLWCMGKIPPPPHCPFDRGIIQSKKLLDFPKDNWTEVDDDGTYLKWVSKAEEKRRNASGGSISEWELGVWNAAQPSGKGACRQATSTEPFARSTGLSRI